MPKITQYRRQVGERGVGSPRLASSGNIGAALGNLGKSVQQAAGVIADKEEASQRSRANSDLVNAQAELFEEMEQSKLTANPDGSGFSEGVDKLVTSKREKLLENAESQFMRDIISSSMDNVKLSMFKHSKTYEIETAGRYEAQQIGEGVKKGENIVRSNPTFREDIWAGQEKLILDAPNINASVKPKILNQAKNSIYDAAFDGMITPFVANKGNTVEDVDAMINEVTSGGMKGNEWTNNTSKAAFDSGLSRLQKYKETLGSQRKSEFIDAFNEEMLNLRTTGNDRKVYTEDSIKRMNFDPAKEKKLLEKLDLSRQVGKESLWIKDAPASEITKKLSEDNLLKKLNANPTDKTNEILGAFQARIRALNKRESAYKKDAPGYMMSIDDDIADRFAEIQKKVAAREPIESIAAQADHYVSGTIAKQKKLWPNRIPSILPKAKIGQLAAAMSGLENNAEGVQQARRLLQEEQQLWGKNWPLAVKDMRDNKVLTDEMYVAASMYNQVEKTHLAEEMLRSSVSSEAEIKKIIGEAKYKDYRRVVRKELEPFLASVRHMTPRSSKDIQEAFTESLTKLAAHRTANNKKADIEGLVRSIVLENYNFEDDYRVPVNVDFDDIQDRVDVLQDSLDKYTYVLPRRDAFGQPEATNQVRFRNNMMEKAKVVNNNDIGLRVVDQHGRQVSIIENGEQKDLKWSWEELAEDFKTETEIRQATPKFNREQILKGERDSTATINKFPQVNPSLRQDL